MATEMLSSCVVQAKAKSMTRVTCLSVLTLFCVIGKGSLTGSPVKASHHDETQYTIFTEFPVENTTFPEDPANNLTQSPLVSGEKKILIISNDDNLGKKYSDQDGGVSLSPLKVPTHPSESRTLTPEVQFEGPKTSNSVFGFYVNSELQGHLQTEGYGEGSSVFTDEQRLALSVIGPSNHVMMLSYATMEVNSCDMQTVDILIGGRNLSEADLVETVCEGTVPEAKVYLANSFHLFFQTIKRGSSRLKPYSFGSFRLQFSFHKKTSPILQQLPSGLWNCSVPQWSEFQSHFRCNYDTECTALEDEIDCPYTGRCPPGHIAADGNCYIYINPRRPISWIEGNIMCAEQHGGYLVSLNTPEEWSGVTSAMRLIKSDLTFLVGIRPADSQKLLMYRKQFEWADGSIAVYLQYVFIFGTVNGCGTFYGNEVSVVFMCNQRYRRHLLCELGHKGSKPQNANFTIPQSISSNQTLPFRHVRCPQGHMAHAFLACDAKTSCFRELYVSSEVGGTASCPAQLRTFPPPFQCQSGFDRVPLSLVCDHRADCIDGSDEDFCHFALCDPSKEMQCGTSKQCILRKNICDGLRHCADGIDERNCGLVFERSVKPETVPPPALVKTSWFYGTDIVFFTPENLVHVVEYPLPCPDGFFQCAEDGYCFDVQFRCNGVRDCPGGEDEARCADYSCPGMYRCRGSTMCYRAEKLCDGFSECPQRDDELFCDFQCPVNCTCYGLAFTCPLVFPVTQFPHLRYLDASDSGLTARHVNHSGLLIHLSLARCGLLHLGNLTLPNLRSLDLSGNNLSVVSDGEVSRLHNLREIVLRQNPLALVFLTNGQSSLTLRYVDLSHVRLTSLTVGAQLPFLQFVNLSFTGLDELQGTGFQSLSSVRVIDLRGCPMTHFPPHIFQNLHQLRTLHADSYKLCCQAVLPVGFNPKNCHAPEDTVSSCDRLLKYDTHVVTVAISAAVSMIGNALGFAVRVFSKTSSDKSVQDVFLSHLCISDFVMGIYLVIIGVADRLFRGTYLWKDVTWRHSLTCKAAGICFAMSCQISSLFIFTITVEHVVYLYSRRSILSSNPRTAHAVTSVVWILGFVSVFTPLYTSRWTDLTNTAVCIPLVSTEQDSSTFLDLLVIPQCTLHTGIMAAQIYIFIKTKPDPLIALKTESVTSQIALKTESVTSQIALKTESVTSQIALKTESVTSQIALKTESVTSQMADARRFFPVAVCSCLCRAAVLVLALSLYHGGIVSNPVRVAASVLVLPLSSALHPVLYAYGALRESRQAAQNERLLKYLMAKRRAKILNLN